MLILSILSRMGTASTTISMTFFSISLKSVVRALRQCCHTASEGRSFMSFSRQRLILSPIPLPHHPIPQPPVLLCKQWKYPSRSHLEYYPSGHAQETTKTLPQLKLPEPCRAYPISSHLRQNTAKSARAYSAIPHVLSPRKCFFKAQATLPTEILEVIFEELQKAKSRAASRLVSVQLNKIAAPIAYHYLTLTHQIYISFSLSKHLHYSTTRSRNQGLRMMFASTLNIYRSIGLWM